MISTVLSVKASTTDQSTTIKLSSLDDSGVTQPVITSISRIKCNANETCSLCFNSSESFVKKSQNWTENIFKLYSEHGYNYMVEDGLVRLLTHIGLIDGSGDNHEDHDHDDHDKHGDHDEHDDHEESHDDHDEEFHFENETSIVLRSVTDVLNYFYHGVPHEDVKIFYAEFALLLPKLLYDFQNSEQVTEEHEDHPVGKDENRGRVWAIALVSVAVISLLSVIGIMIVPLMGKSRHFKRLLSFLVALAVGTLVGDALLHLLPHAMGGAEGHDHSGDGVMEERNKIVKNLVAVLGIYMFFVFESSMGMVRKRRQKNRKQKSSMDHSPNHAAGLPSNKSQEYLIANKPEFDVPLLPTPDSCSSNKSDDIIAKSTDSGISSTNNIGFKYSNESTAKTIRGGKTPPFPINLNLDDDDDVNICDDIKITHVPNHDHSDHGGHDHHHHHHHGNITNAQGIKDLAWMIIAGDGLHNFSDGLAIGAAFSSSIAAGLSTSLAIFCHELPHELGDFAILIDAGMSIKKALLYNGLCACLAFIGVILGLVIGEYTTSIKLWILAITAGGFLYVALVDMLPQMLLQCVQHEGFVRFVYQNIGLLFGIIIMLLIAWYEESFSRIFEA